MEFLGGCVGRDDFLLEKPNNRVYHYFNSLGINKW